MVGVRLESLLTLCLGIAMGLLLMSGGPGKGDAPSPCHCTCDCSAAGSLGPVAPSSRDAPLVTLPSASGKGSLINADNLVAHADLIMGRIGAAVQAMGQPDGCGVDVADATPLLSVADLAQVDVMFESGTAGGESAELMAHFFQGTHVQIITVDYGTARKAGGCGAKVADGHQRLKPFGNVQALMGDSFKVFPKLIKEHAGKRIGLFIDGPKRMDQVRLCMASLRASADVKFCAFHDVKPDRCHNGGGESYEYLGQWGRLVLRSCCWNTWLSHFGLKYCDASTPSVAIVAGRDTFPLGVAGDF